MPENIGIGVLLTFVAKLYQKIYDFKRNSVLNSGHFVFFGLISGNSNMFHLKEHKKTKKKLVSEDRGEGGGVQKRSRYMPDYYRYAILDFALVIIILV